MTYVEFNAGNKEYRLRLGVRDTVSLEKKLGCNPLGIFGDGETIPTITTMVDILHAAMQKYHHGISISGAADIFEEWLEDGNTATDFIQVIIEVYKVSGIIAKDDDSKNA